MRANCLKCDKRFYYDPKECIGDYCSPECYSQTFNCKKRDMKKVLRQQEDTINFKGIPVYHLY